MCTVERCSPAAVRNSTRAEQSLRAELLLAGHSLVGAASLGKTLTLALIASPVAAFGHINWPVLMRAAMLALQVVADAPCASLYRPILGRPARRCCRAMAARHGHRT
jgi:hypothetical protein